MRILLLSSSARGHAIADAIKRSRHSSTIISVALKKNPGIHMLGGEFYPVPSLTDCPSILNIAKKTKPDLAIIGPEDPIACGISDLLLDNDIPCVAPTRCFARIESSKGFARNLCEKYSINCSPNFLVQTYFDKKKLNKFIDQYCHGEFVVKYDSLKSGKGVKVYGDHFQTVDDGIAYAKECIDLCGQVVIEEKMTGCEFSLISFVSGSTVIDCPIIQDHKRAYDGDTGPNTGGMGTYSDADHSLPFLTKKDIERAREIQRLVVKALTKENKSHSYRGILYGGFIATSDDVKVIEFNCRFGDPEALNILSLLESDFIDICQAIVTGDLSEDIVRFARKATVCKYIVPKGYPENNDQIGMKVGFSMMPSRARLFYGDVSFGNDQTLHLGGSRTAGIVGIGDTIAEAEYIAQHLCEKVQGPVRYRSDIGTGSLIRQRIDLIRQLRS